MIPILLFGAQLQVAAHTDVPLDVGVRVSAEGPGRVLLSSSLGVMPRPYVRGINETVIALGGYDRHTADLIEDTLSSSLVWRTHAGWRPFPQAGFTVEGGLGVVTLGGDVTSGTLLSEAFQVRIPDWMSERYTFEVTSTLTQADLELGWGGPFGAHLAWRAALGGVWTARAHTEVTPQFDPGWIEGWVRDFGEDSAARLDAQYEQFVRIPVVSAGIGGRW